MQANWKVPLPIPVLVIAHLVAGVAAVACGVGKTFPDPALVIAYALLLAQISLVAIWLGIGGGPIALRFASGIAILGAIHYGLSSLHDNHDAWLRLMVVQALAVMGPLTIGRWCGLRLQPKSFVPDERPWQFTLKHVFVLTTSFALLLGLLRLAPSPTEFGNRSFEALLMGGGFALMALIAAWVSLGYGRVVFKVLALPTITVLVGWVVTVFVSGPGNGRLGVMAIVLGQMLVVSGSLAVLRCCGYRLVRQRRMAALGD